MRQVKEQLAENRKILGQLLNVCADGAARK